MANGAVTPLDMVHLNEACLADRRVIPPESTLVSSRLTSLRELKLRQSLSLVAVTAVDHRQESKNG